MSRRDLVRGLAPLGPSVAPRLTWCEAEHPETGEPCLDVAIVRMPLLGIGDLFLCAEHCA